MSDIVASESSEIQELAAALAKAQCTLACAGKTHEAQIRSEKGTYKYAYATLADCWRSWQAAGPPNGLALIQQLLPADPGYTLRTKLVHTSGQWIASELRVVGGNTPQALGSIITYMRRYAMCGLLGIVSDDDEEDDDGGEAEVDAQGARLAAAAAARGLAAERREPLAPERAPQAEPVAAGPPDEREKDDETKAVLLLREARSFAELGQAGVEVAKLTLSPEARHRCHELYRELKAALQR